MKKLFIICSVLLICSCSSISKNNTTLATEIPEHHELQVSIFSDLPKELIDNIDKMGVDNRPVLNEHEGRFINTIFKINPQDFDFVGKKVGFLLSGKSSKLTYFVETRERYSENSSIIGGSGLYIFDATQKEKSGGYDAEVVYWNKFVLPTDKVVQQLKK